MLNTILRRNNKNVVKSEVTNRQPAQKLCVKTVTMSMSMTSASMVNFMAVQNNKRKAVPLSNAQNNNNDEVDDDQEEDRDENGINNNDDSNNEEEKLDKHRPWEDDDEDKELERKYSILLERENRIAQFEKKVSWNINI